MSSENWVQPVAPGWLTLWSGAALALMVSWQHCDGQPTQPAEAVQSSEPAALVVGTFTGGAQGAVVSVLEQDLRWVGLLDGAPAVERGRPGGGGSGLEPWKVEGRVSGSDIRARLIQPGGNPSWARNYRGDDLRLNVHRLADDVVASLTGQPGIATTRIAYVRETPAGRELFSCDYDGRNEVQLTRDRSTNVGPSLSADGRFLVYTGYLGGFPDLFVIDLEFKDRARLVDAPGLTSGPALSPNGELIALTMSFTGDVEVHVVSMQGGASRRVTEGGAFSPSWSPDGRRLAVAYAGERGMDEPSIALCGLESGSVELLESSYRACVDPAWSPDGRSLAYSAIDEQGATAIVVRDLRSGAERLVAADAVEPAWSGRSGHLIFVRDGELHQVELRTGRQRRIARSAGGRISEPTWSWWAPEKDQGDEEAGS